MSLFSSVRGRSPNAVIILTVDAQLVKRLLELNRAFYAEFARAFSETRAAERVDLAPLAPYLYAGARVLEVGCGNGRLVERLDREGYRLNYLGVDVTPALIEIAEARRARLRHSTAEFRGGDITAPAWVESMRARAPFDVALALAVLHHIPSFELRRAVLRDLHALLRPEGVLVLSNWQFTRNARLRKKIVSWQTLGIDERALEEGDALLDWKRGGTGLRYCHLLTAAEVQALAAQSGFQVCTQFYADAALNLFSVLVKTAPLRQNALV